MPNTVPAAATGLPNAKTCQELVYDADDLVRFLDTIREILGGGVPRLVEDADAINRFYSLVNIAHGAAQALKEQAASALDAAKGRA